MARNPFSRIASPKADDTAAVREAAAARARRDDPAATEEAPATAATPVAASPVAQTAIKDAGLQQPTTESDDGHASDTPPAVDNNEGSSTESFGLGEFQRPEKTVATPDDGANAGVAAGPKNPADTFGIETGQEGGGSGSAVAGGGNGFAGVSPKESVAAASGGHGPGIDLTTAPNLAAVAGTQGSGESLLDLQTALAGAAIAGAAAVETGPSVAEGRIDAGVEAIVEFAAVAGGIAAAGTLEAAIIAGGSLGPAGLAAVAIGGGAFIATRKADEATDGTFTDVVTILGAAGPVGLAAASGAALGVLATAIEDELAREAAAKKAADEKEAAEEKAAAEKAAAEKAAAEKAAAEKAAAEKEAAEKEAGGGVKTSTDPDNPDGPRPRGEFALSQAIKAELGLVHNPLGELIQVVGDGTNTGTAKEGNLSAADQILRSGATGLVGLPREDRVAPAPSGVGAPSLGPDGTEILVEDGNPFTGGTRSEDEPNFNVGSDPLVGFPPPEEEADEDTSKVTSLFNRFQAKDTDGE